MLLLLFSPLLLATACEDNPVAGDDHADIDAVGFIFEIDGDELLRRFRQVTTTDPEGQLPHYFDDEGNLTLTEELLDADGRSRDRITVRWLNRDEEVFDLPPAYEEGERTDSEWMMEFEVKDPDGEELDSDTAPIFYEIDTGGTGWQFRFVVREPATVEWTVKVMHMLPGNPHTDFVSRLEIPVQAEL